MKTVSLGKNASETGKGKKDIGPNDLQSVTWRPPPCCGVGLEVVFNAPKKVQKEQQE